MSEVREIDVVVIGAGQAGLSAAYFLRRAGFEPETGFVVLDADPKLQLVGYGPSASTVGANRAGRTAVRAVRQLLGPRSTAATVA